MRSTRTLTFASLCAATALAVTGCSDGNDPGGDSPAQTVSIGSLAGLDDGSDWSPESARADEDRIQEFVATCMAEQGWEYIPISYPDTFYDYDEGDELERIEREGMGIAYWALNQDNEDGFNDPWMDFVDPNNAIVEALSESEQEAYYEALHGSWEDQEAEMTMEIDPETGEEYYVSYGWGGGCQGEAYEEVWGGQGGADSEGFHEALNVFYEELYERVLADPRMIKMNEDWISCMSAAGYEYENRDDFWMNGYDELYTRHDEIMGVSEYVDPFEGWSDTEIDDFFATATEAEIDAMFGHSVELTSEQRAGLEELLADEIALATADYKCAEGQGETQSEIYAEIEARYAEENRAALEELAAQYGSDT